MPNKNITETTQNDTAKKNGFTLMEMLIVVTIIGILAAIVIPRFVTSSTQAKDSANKVEKQMINSQLELYYFKNGQYPVSIDEAGWGDSWPDYFPEGIPTADAYEIEWNYDAKKGRIVD